MSDVVRYDMPAGFGPSLMPPQTKVENATAAIISFETDTAALASLMPRHLDVAEPATVSISRIHYPTTDYMGGRGYEELIISFSAKYGAGEKAITTGFAAVLWVDQFGALFAGREFQGLAKLMGNIPPIKHLEGGLCFECAEYGSPLIRGKIDGLTLIEGETFEKVRKGSAVVPTFGWKYISSTTRTPDADYATVNYTRWDYEKAWSGVGSVEFFTPSTTEAPFSSRILAALAGLPVHKWKRAFVGTGTVIIDRTMTRRL